MKKLLEKKIEGKLLIFAPESILWLSLQRYIPGCDMATTDLYRNDVDLPGEDIQKLSFPDNSFAMILCNHVLEHVIEDQKAIEECFRILKPGGLAVLTVPGDFSQEKTKEFPQPDNNGHYRHYGMDFIGRLKRVFPEVEALDMGKGTEKKWHIRRHDYLFICKKL